jgi:glutamine amidotransferase
MRTVYVVDTGLSNIYSLVNALEFLEARVEVVTEPQELKNARKIILPGVGSFHAASRRLSESGLGPAIVEAVIGKQGHILGICLGMQLLSKASYEHGYNEGLGLISGEVTRFDAENGARQVQNVGFNSINWISESKLSAGLKPNTSFYFTHSYKLLPESATETVGTTINGVPFTSVVDNGIGVFGTQFHPEKSQRPGLKVIENYVNI